MANSDSLVGVVATHADGTPLTDAERAAIVEEQNKELEGWWSWDMLTPLGAARAGASAGESIVESASEGFSAKLENWVGSVAFIVIGVLFITLALLTTDAGQTLTKAAITRGRSK